MAEILGDISNSIQGCDRIPAIVRRPIGGASSRREIREVADRAGFEPARRFPAYTLSKRAPSATRPPVLFYAISALRDAKYRLVKATYKGKKPNYQQFCPFRPPKA